MGIELNFIEFVFPEGIAIQKEGTFNGDCGLFVKPRQAGERSSCAVISSHEIGQFIWPNKRHLGAASTLIPSWTLNQVNEGREAGG